MIEFKCRKIPRIAQKQKKNPRKQCMIEFKHRELPKIAQKFIEVNHSMAIANLEKSEDFVTNTNAASKYIPRKLRISIN